jgi:hypothetical protein
MKNSNIQKEIVDISSRSLKKGDIVFVLDTTQDVSDTVHIMSSSVLGEIISVDKDDLVKVKIGNDIFDFDSKTISKIDTSEPIDDIFAHLSQDVENIQLIKEAEILDKMLKS